MTITFSQTETSSAIVYRWRNMLNRMSPCILACVVLSHDRIDVQTEERGLFLDGVRLDLSQNGRVITPANLAAALGELSVRCAAEELVDIAQGRKLSNGGTSCARICSTVFAQASRYPLDRPDLRLPHEREPE